jgi:hypothetical protein
MAGAINLGVVTAADGGQATFSLSYNDSLQATQFNGTNNSATASVQARVVGLAADGSEDPNKTFALILSPGASDFVGIPLTGAKAVQLAVNARGRVAGFNTYLG